MSKTAVDNFHEQEADKALDIEDLVEDKRDDFAKRIVHLLNNPDDRNPEIMEYFLGYFSEMTAIETGSVELAQLYWEQIAELVIASNDELHSVPQPDRGEIWTKTKQLMGMWVIRQAYIESGIPNTVLQDRAKDVDDTAKTREALSKTEQKAVAEDGHDIRGTMKVNREKRNNGG
jgi:hypothetical protein